MRLVHWAYQDRRLNKDMAKHLFDTKSTAEDIVFAPSKRLKSGSRLNLKHFENKVLRRVLTSLLPDRPHPNL